MKNSFWVMALFIFAFGTMLTSCETSDEKVENAEENVAEAKADLAQAQQNYMDDVAVFKQQTADQIAANNKTINDFNARVRVEKKEAKAEIKEKIAELERKNSDLQIKLDSYKAESINNWEAFKLEFNRDMEQLGAALKDLTVKNN